VLAVDISSERCERLRQNERFEVLCSDVTAMPGVASQEFDFVICTQVIEHVDETSLLNEIKRILSPGGKLYIASLIRKPYGWWYYRTADGKWALDPTHLREYPSPEVFKEVLTKAGFKVVETVVTPLKLSVFEFLMRRVIGPLFRFKDMNSFFLKHRGMNSIRKNVNVHPPGYFIIEVVATKAP
jgi:ubiquinone/menaquinone biosynthesis C-methylase UbiE